MQGSQPPESFSSLHETQFREPAPERPQEEVRFTPGTVIGGRYRIVSLLGAGGMGEVYRADDLRLGQKVALKYVPKPLAEDRGARERLYEEVRIGRQIAHPNVCRLYDLIEIEGQHFISMEYVDGEDLGSLLRRIGRLPADKAMALARDLCSGLAAAHEGGIVHRDLKPANVMIDGRGRARITDFGLAALVAEAARRREFAGTPAYMSPEQLDGQPATARSDLYALGLVLYEMFTGVRVFEARTIESLREEHTKPKERPSSRVREIDPAVERLILQCLEENPAARPPSARAMLASLPGGDPLQAAIAAGETPSPAVVAAAGKVGDLSPRAAWALLATLLGLLVAATVIQHRTSLEGWVPRLKSRDALADRAREVIAAHGGAADPRDLDHSWIVNHAYLQALRASGSGWERLRSTPPSAHWFLYRESPESLIPFNGRRVMADDPPETVPGMSSVVLDGEGRLVRFRTVPGADRGEGGTPEWDGLFAEAGLDRAEFAPAAPRGAVSLEHDQRAAWVGRPASWGGIELRVEAASMRGAPVYFEVFEPWRSATTVGMPRRYVAHHAIAGFYLGCLLFAALLARRNVLHGRSDRRGALRMAAVVAVASFLGGASVADHVLDLAAEWDLVVLLAGAGLFSGLTVWVFHLALEPFVRRRWPHMLISWMRLLGGRTRDPMVGRDVLYGAIAGTAAVLIQVAGTLVAQPYGRSGVPFPRLTHLSMDSPLGFGFIAFSHVATAVIYAFGWLAMVLIFRLVTGSDRVAFLMLAASAAMVGIGEDPVVDYLLALGVVVPMVVVLRRFGVVALATSLFFYYGLLRSPLTLDASQWYALRSAAVLLMMAAIGCWGFHRALAGKPLFGSILLEEEAAT